eukprot:6169890-Amphidinium_carterae.1
MSRLQDRPEPTGLLTHDAFLKLHNCSSRSGRRSSDPPHPDFRQSQKTRRVVNGLEGRSQDRPGLSSPLCLQEKNCFCFSPPFALGWGFGLSEHVCACCEEHCVRYMIGSHRGSTSNSLLGGCLAQLCAATQVRPGSYCENAADTAAHTFLLQGRPEDTLAGYCFKHLPT